jgi:thioredoxin reductase (NADPH)
MGIEEQATPTLNEADMALIAEYGERRQVEEGDYLYHEGDATNEFFVVVSAEIDVLMTVDGEERIIISHGPGRFLGELNMLSGLRVYVSARVARAGDVIAISRDRPPGLAWATPSSLRSWPGAAC